MELSKVPKYLQQSSLFRTFAEEQYEIIPENVPFSASEVITDFDNLHNMLHMLNFWGIDNTPWFVFKFVHDKSTTDCNELMKIIDDFEHSPFYNQIKIFIQFTDMETRELAIINDDLDVFRYIQKHGCVNESVEYILTPVLKYGARVEFLEDSHTQLTPEHYIDVAKAGHIDLMKYMNEVINIDWEWDLKGFWPGTQRTDGSNILIEAIVNDHMDCFDYARKNGCTITIKVISDLITHNKIDAVKLTLPTVDIYNSEPINLLEVAANIGNLDMLMYVHTQFNHISIETMIAAACAGNAECLSYLFKSGGPTNYYILIRAAGEGHLECMKIAHKNGCPWNYNVIHSAAHHGHLECMKYAHENGCPWGRGTIEIARANGNIECVVYAVQKGCPTYN